MCARTSLYLILPISRHCIAAAAETHLAVIPYVSSLLNVTPQVFQLSFTTSLLCIFHIMSPASNTFPQSRKRHTGSV